MAKKNRTFLLLSLFITIFVSAVLPSCTSTKAVAKLDQNDITEMVTNKNFVFVAERVNPLRGRTRQLTSEYDVQVRNDSLTSYLPYFGRAHVAPMDPSQGGIQFTSTDFSYNTNQGNGWSVIIKPNDHNDVQQMVFNIFENGTATLSVTSTNRDPISFNGYVKKNQE